MSEKGKKYRAIIWGPGAVGTVVGAKMAHHGWQVAFRNRRGALSSDFNATVIEQGRVQLNISSQSLKHGDNIHLGILAVKAFDLEKALKNALEILPPYATIWCLSNGATATIIDTVLGSDCPINVRLGYCTFGARKSEDGSIHIHTKDSKGAVVVGPRSAHDGALFEWERSLLGENGIPLFTWKQDILYLQHRKWLFNTVINSLSGANQWVPNGTLLLHLGELYQVFKETYYLGSELWGSWREEKEELFLIMCRLLEGTAGNENSMARDVRLGRKTESSFFAGLAKDDKKYPLLTSLHRRIECGI